MTGSRGLNESQLEAVAELEARVVAHDGGRLKLEWPTLRSRPTDRIRDFLCWSSDGSGLLGFIGIYGFGHGVLELAGMVDPQVRRSGIASELLKHALDECRPEQSSALLVVARNAAGGDEFALARGGQLEHSEHAMLLSEEPAPGPALPGLDVRLATPEDVPRIVEILHDAFDGYTGTETTDPVFETPTCRRLVITLEGEVVGAVRARLDADRGSVYGFAVRRELRGQGIGHDALRRVCADLLSRGATAVGLEVLTDNDRALGLYASLGFARIATEDYYEMSV